MAEDKGKIEVDPNDSTAYNTRGLSYHELDQYERAIELDPKSVAAYNNRGGSYYAIGHYQRSIEDFDKAIELDLFYAVAYYNRGLAYGALGQYSQKAESSGCTLGFLGFTLGRCTHLENSTGLVGGFDPRL